MIITISGQYGSGGNEIGKALAEKLGYRILDSQLVIRAREIFNAHSGGEKPVWWPSRNNEVFDEHDDIPELDCAYEQAKFRLQTDLIAPTQQYAVLGKDAEKYQAAMLYAQTRAIMEYIEDGNCIIFGKCSNFILRGRKDAIHIFTKADTESRIKRIMNLYNAPSEMKKAERWSPTAYSFEDTGNFKNMTKYTALGLIQTTDERRAACYEFITGEKWGYAPAFTFVLDGTEDVLDQHVEKILTEVKKREG